MIEAAYKAYCRERFPLPTEKQVADLERRIGVSFPEDFRQFVLEYNGGYFIEPDIVPPSKDCPVDCLTSIFGIGASHPTAELASRESLAVFSDNEPPQVVPIGDTIMGNLLLLVTHPEGRGCIVLKKAFSDQSFFLAGGIEEFFGLLREPSDEDEDGGNS